MNQGKSFLKRFFALVMALALLVSGTNLGAVLQVSAAEAETNVTAGELVASNYELTAAEKDLLNSGLLAGETYTFTTPDNSDNLIAVDTEKAEITAKSYKTGAYSWIPVKAYIVANGEVVETVNLVAGTGKYDPAVGNAFAVKVDYLLEIEVSEATQSDLLNAAKWLNAGLDNVKAAYTGTDANLGTVVLAMDALEMLAAGITMSFGPDTSFGVQFGEEARAAVAALGAEIEANGGQLALQVKNAEYAAAASKAQYLVENGADYKAVAEQTLANLAAIKNDGLMNNSILDSYMQSTDAASYTQWKALKGIIGNLVSALEAAAAADWTVLEKNLVKADMTAAEYAALDAKLAAVTAYTAVEVNPALIAGETTLQANLSMFNVTVVVSLSVVENKADSNELIECGKSELVLTLAEGITAEEIKAAVEESGIVDFNLDAWAGLYVAEHFEMNESALPENLVEDIVYEIKFAPKAYTVTGDLGEMEVYYGYQLTLPAHEDEAQSYDYSVNGKAYAQGEIAVIEGDTIVTRSSGKAYASTDLYTVVADNYGNALAQEILKSGALKGNVAINVRKPDPADAATLLTLLDGTLTAKNYNASYAGLSWVPYSYGATLENNFSGNTAAWNGKEAKVQYILRLTNFTEAQVAEVLALAETLKAEANEQKSTMDAFAANYDTMGSLGKTELGALVGVIGVTDLHSDPAKNEELKAYFSGLVSGIINNNVDANGKLKIYNMLGQYNVDGLRYYYNNASTIIAEIESLAANLNGMLADEEKMAALTTLVTAAGFPQYADKIAELETILADVLASLTMPNEAIALDSKNLGKLLDALVKEEEVVVETAATPYLLSEVLTALDESSVMVQVIITTPAGTATVATAAMDRGTVLTADVVNTLKAQVAAEVAKLIGDTTFYNVSVSTSLDSLVGTEIDANINVYYEYTVKQYTVKIEGENDQVVTINDREINLPKHPVSGSRYEYNVDGVSGITASTYTFTLEQLARLFADGSYTITRVEINEAVEKVETTFADWLVKDENGNIIGLRAEVEGNQGGLMGFALKMVESGYTYIGLNGEAFLYLAEDNSLEICLQTLINAVLNDNSFSSQTLINMGKNGKGQLVKASMQLGNSADDIHYEDLDFVLYLTSVPSQMATVAKGLETIKPYMTFASNNGVMDVKIDLPEKVYEAYLTAMLATGNVEKADITTLNSEIAYEFLWDYVDTIINSDANTTTYTNTLAKVGVNYDLTGAEKYYQMVKKAVTNDGVQINPDENGIFDMTVTGKSQKAINALISMLGIDVSAYNTYLGMIKEYKYADAELSAACNAWLVDAGTAFEAALVDINALKAGGKDMLNGADFTTDLVARLSKVTGQAAVMLLNDVDGNLVFNGTTILDLNGQTVNGNIVANGTLYIVDSSMDTFKAGTVTGTVSGNAVIFGGNFASDVSKYLKSGYVQTGSTVHNVLYTVSSTEAGDLTFELNTDVLSEDLSYTTFAKAVAVDVAVDLILNYYTTAALAADGNALYHINFDDILGLLTSTNKVDDLIQKVLNCIDVPGMSNFINVVLADMIDFAAIEAAAAGDKVFATYSMTTAPWKLAVYHQTEGDYITAGITYNEKLAKTYNVSLKLAGSKVAYVEKLAGTLAEIVVADGTYITIDAKQPVYDGKDNLLTVQGAAEASLEIDFSANANYLTIITVALANGNAEDKAALIEALNARDMVALKAAIDETTVEDVFTALKALNRNEKFADIAAKLGVTLDVAEAAELESIYHIYLCAMGKVLEELDITGMNSKLGALDKDNDGVYEWGASASRNPSASAGGYSVYAEASVKVALKVRLFPAECNLNDPNHDGVIDILDVIYLRKLLANPEKMDEILICAECADVNDDGYIDVMDLIALRKYLAWQ